MMQNSNAAKKAFNGMRVCIKYKMTDWAMPPGIANQEQNRLEGFNNSKEKRKRTEQKNKIK